MKANSKICVIVFVFIILTLNSFAQTKTIISINQAIDSAVQNYPELAAKKNLVESAKWSVRDAKDLRLPALILDDQVDIGTANSVNGPYFPMGIIPSTSGSIREENTTQTYTGSLGIAYMSYELYNFGLNKARIQSAKALLNNSTADYNREIYLLQYRVAQLYFDLLRYKLLTDVQQKNIDRYSVLYNYIKAYTNSGMKAGVDSSVANAEMSNAKIKYIQTFADYNKIKSEFIYYTGITNLNFDVDTGLYNLSNQTVNQLKSNVIIDTVGENNPLLAFYKTRWEYGLAQQKLVKKSFLPKLYLLGAAWTRGSDINSSDEFGNINNGFSYDRYNYLGGLTLAYNIVDLLHKRDKSAIFGYQAQAEEEEFFGQRIALANQLNQADIDIQATVDRLKEIPFQLKAAQDAFSQKSAQYNSGLADIAQLTDVSYLLYTAQTEEVTAKTDLLINLLQKSITNNTLNIFLNQFR